jgi:hypothetical protein
MRFESSLRLAVWTQVLRPRRVSARFDVDSGARCRRRIFPRIQAVVHKRWCEGSPCFHKRICACEVEGVRTIPRSVDARAPQAGFGVHDGRNTHFAFDFDSSGDLPLQWSHVLSNVETSICADADEKSEGASMEPRSLERGNDNKENSGSDRA